MTGLPERLSEAADIGVDNMAPHGNTATIIDRGVGAGAFSSITAGFITQLLTIGIADARGRRGKASPVCPCASVPGGEQRNRALASARGDRTRRGRK